MEDSTDIRALFRSEKIASFDFSDSPRVVQRIGGDGRSAGAPAEGSRGQQWQYIQQKFLKQAKSGSHYGDERVRHTVEVYDRFFRQRGQMAGNVLDIGGGWGTKRQWWQGRESDVFVVHDPGVERARSGAHAAHRTHYPRAFQLPMTFVEGFGEDLPYRDDLFDTCLIASALDHFADPWRVVSEARRCLKPGGRILIFQTCRLATRASRTRYSLRLTLKRPWRLPKKLSQRYFAPEKHMNKFTASDVMALLQDCGFANVSRSAEPIKTRVYVFEGT